MATSVNAFIREHGLWEKQAVMERVEERKILHHRIKATLTDIKSICLEQNDHLLAIAEAYDKGYVTIGTNNDTMFLMKKKTVKI